MCRVSVLMPVYNCERYLRDAIESVLKQTYEDFEFVIVDDGSTDRTPAVLQAYADSDRRIRVLARPNTGIVGALNNGLALCRGEYIARMDGDDIALPQRFDRQVRYLDAHSECVAVGSASLRIDSDGDPISVLSVPSEHEAIDLQNISGARGGITHPTAMIRRSAIGQLGGYREEYLWSEDLDLFLRLAEVGRLANLQEVLLLHRMHLKKVSCAHQELQCENCARTVAEARRRRGMPEQQAESRKNIVSVPDDVLLRCWSWDAIQAEYQKTARKLSRQALARNWRSRDNWSCFVQMHVRSPLVRQCIRAVAGCISRILKATRTLLPKGL